MTSIKLMIERCNLPVLYVEHLFEKGEVSKRRRHKSLDNSPLIAEVPEDEKTRHFTGRFRDEELRRGPKYWCSHTQQTTNPIKTYQDLATAIGLIASGDKNYRDYPGVSGINEERLRLAQLWKERGIRYDVSDILNLNLSKIKSELGDGRLNDRRVYR